LIIYPPSRGGEYEGISDLEWIILRPVPAVYKDNLA